MSTSRPSRIYVGASSNEIDRAIHWMSKLKLAGLDVTSTWPATIKNVGDANPRDASDVDRHAWSSSDFHKIDNADTLWMLAPNVGTGRDAYAELGYAKGREKLVVISGDTKQSIFCAQGAEFADDLDAFAALCRWARDGVPW